MRKFLGVLAALCILAVPAKTATWMAPANINLSGSWGTVENYVSAETAAAPVTNAVLGSQASATFVITAAHVIDGFAIKLALRNAVPSGTIQIQLWDNTLGAQAAGCSQTISVSTLPLAATADHQGGFIFIKCSSNYTSIGNPMQFRVVGSVASGQVSIWSSTTTINGSTWDGFVRTTVTGMPTTGDDMIAVGEYTGSGGSPDNSWTVTMDSTATTQYGSGAACTNVLTTCPKPALAVGNGATFSYGASASTNYVLRLSGAAKVYGKGTMNVGTVATAIPRNSTAVLEFVCVADGDFGLIALGESTLSIQGLSRTSGKNVVKTLLTSNAAVNATILNVADDTGWLSGDAIAVANTGRSSDVGNHNEAGALNGNAGASSLTVNGFGGVAGGVAFAHDGVSPIQAEIVNYTRNVKVRSTSASAGAFLYSAKTATTAIAWAEFSNFGANTAQKRSIETDTTTGSFSLTFSAIHDTRNFGVVLNATQAITANTTVQNNVGWNVATQNGIFLDLITGVSAGSSAAWLIDNNTVIQVVASYGFLLADVTGTFTNNTTVGAHTYGIGITATEQTIGTMSGNIIHSNSSDGWQFAAPGLSGTISGGSVWRNSGLGDGLYFQNATNLTLDSISIFGQLLNITLAQSQNMVWKNLTINGDTTASSNVAAQFDDGTFNITIDNSQFSVVSGIKTQMATDLAFGTGGKNISARVVTRNTIMNGTTPVLATSLTPESYVCAEKNGQVAGAHKCWSLYGTTSTDTAIINFTSPSMRMAPTSAAGNLPSAEPFNGIKVPVINGTAANVCVWARTSVIGDSGGSNYNGIAPIMVQKADPSLGQNNDVTLRTTSLSAGAWGQTCADTSIPTDNGSFQVVMQAGGSGWTTGWVNVGDWSQTGGPSNCNGAFWFNGLPCQVIVPFRSMFIGGFLFNRDIAPASNDNMPAFLALAG